MLLILSKDELKKTIFSEDSLLYDSGIYWFRDYWSNRLKLGRNVAVENDRIDIEKDILVSELTVTQNSNSEFSLQWSEGRIDDVVDPLKLARQLEPNRIFLSLKKPGLRDEAPDPHFNMDPRKIKDATAEPVASSKGEARLWIQLLLRVIIPSLVLMLVEWVVLSYIASSVPELAYFTFVILVASLAGFIYGSLIIFIKVGVSETARKVIGAKATIYFYEGSHPTRFHYKSALDLPNWLESKPYWVFRYLYTWSFELTFEKGLPVVRTVKDVERLDVWCDAKTGSVEWIVSDYHWRELWYKPNPNLSSINVWLPANFHTPKPLIIPIEDKGKLIDLYDKSNPLAKQWLETVDKYRQAHTKYFQDELKKKPRMVKRMLISEVSGLWWEKWRYKNGANDIIYRNSEISATGGQPNPLVSTSPILPQPTPLIKVATLQTVNSETISGAPANKPISIPKRALNNNSAAKSTATLAIRGDEGRATKNAKTTLYLGIAAFAIATVTAGILLRREVNIEFPDPKTRPQASAFIHFDLREKD